MIRDFILSLVSFFIVEPFQAELNAKLAAAQAPQAIVRDVTSCATAALPVLADRALGDPWWATTTIISVSIGMDSPERVLVEAVPACGPAVRAAQPFLTAARA
jgi:hypothetical protein